jgi:hypothetical protein
MDSPKRDKFDDSFLFSLGLVGLIISFAEIGKNSFSDVAGVIPFFFLGIFVPFFVGYLRGAIKEDSIEERVRGWIYFLIGTASYTAFFVASRASCAYWGKEALFMLGILFGATIAYGFVKWSKDLFGIQEPMTSYAFSATALGVFVFSTFLSLCVGMSADLQVNNILEKVEANFTAFLFFLLIILFFFSTFMIFEKGSRCAIRNMLQLQNEHVLIDRLPSWLRRIGDFFFFFKSVFLGLVLFEYSFDFDLDEANLQARTLWLLSFASWSVGCVFWKLNGSSVASLFFILGIVSGVGAIARFYKSQIDDFRSIPKVLPLKTLYAGCFFVIMTQTTLLQSLDLIATLIRLTILGVVLLIVWLMWLRVIHKSSKSLKSM